MVRNVRILSNIILWIKILWEIFWIFIGILYDWIGYLLAICPTLWELIKFYCKPQKWLPLYKEKYNKKQERTLLINHRMHWWDKYPREFDKFKLSLSIKEHPDDE